MKSEAQKIAAALEVTQKVYPQKSKEGAQDGLAEVNIPENEENLPTTAKSEGKDDSWKLIKDGVVDMEAVEKFASTHSPKATIMALTPISQQVEEGSEAHIQLAKILEREKDIDERIEAAIESAAKHKVAARSVTHHGGVSKAQHHHGISTV